MRLSRLAVMISKCDGREEVQIAVASVASARVIKSIQGPVTEKVLAILFNHCLPYLFVQLWSVFAEKLLENGGGKKPVALFIQVRLSFMVRSLPGEDIAVSVAVNESTNPTFCSAATSFMTLR